jgi:DNA topoisomerase-1
MNVVVVESPAKAKTINKYLGKEYKVLASFGHVRDLPAKDGSVLPDEDFAMSWEVDTASNKRLKDITAALKDADSLILATDPDREGEAISWHVLEVLNKKKALKDKHVRACRLQRHHQEVRSRRDGQSARDRHAAGRRLSGAPGAGLSGRASTSRRCCGAKLPGARSAGRVQSVALRLVCDRESEIERFVREEYWQIRRI